ncbi:MAG TPA: AAA family ATPase [Candidatus Saccharimonadales bacterium]|jgi:hypothetical protein
MKIIHASEYGVTTEDRSNGNGYREFKPDPEAAGPATKHGLRKSDHIFKELPAIVRQLHHDGSVLLHGAAGSGKTNLVQDVEHYCELSATPSMRLSVQIAAGKPAQFPHIEAVIADFIEDTDGDQAVFILDNVDYVNYKGHRSRNRAKAFAVAAVPFLLDAMDEENIQTLGTAHTEQWQQSRWQTDDTEVSELQERLLNAFVSEFEFMGLLSKGGIRKVLGARAEEEGIDEDTIDAALEILTEPKADFHIVRHVDLARLIENPDAAIDEVRAGREKRS